MLNMKESDWEHGKTREIPVTQREREGEGERGREGGGGGGEIEGGRGKSLSCSLIDVAHVKSRWVIASLFVIFGS